MTGISVRAVWISSKIVMPNLPDQGTMPSTIITKVSAKMKRMSFCCFVSTAFSPILAIVAISSVLPILSGGLLYFIELFIAGIALPFEAFSFGVNRFFEDAEIATGLAYYVIVLIICEKCNLSKSLKKCIVVTFFLIFLFSLIFS